MILQDKLNLVTNYFAEDWAINKAMQLLDDYEKMVEAQQPYPTPHADSVTEPVGGVVAVPRETLRAWRQWCAQSMSHAIEHEISDFLAPTQPAKAADSVLEDAARLLESQHTWLTNVAAANLVRSLAARKQGTSHD